MHTTLITSDRLDGEDCIAGIVNLIHDLPGIDTVDVAPETGVICVEHSPLVAEADIRQVLLDAGFDLR